MVWGFLLKFLPGSETVQKWIAYAIMAVLAIGLLWMIYTNHVTAIKQQATLEFNNRQLELTLQQQQRISEALVSIAQTSQRLSEELTKQNERLETQYNEIQNQLTQRFPDDANRPASPLLRETVKELERLQGG